MDDRETQARIHKLRSTARKRARPCGIRDCHEPAIWSHVLQRNGVLSLLAENGRLMVLTEKDYLRGGYYFAEEGIRRTETLAFHGFCQRHDSNLFREVESTVPDFADKRVAMLLSYRAVLCELRKQQNNIWWYDLAANEGDIPEFASRSIQQSQRFAWWLGYELLTAMEDSLFHGRRDLLDDFYFAGYEIGRLEFCSSAVFGGPTWIRRAKNTSLADVYDKLAPSPLCFVHLIPRATSTMLVVGGYRIRPPLFRDEQAARRAVSDVLVKHCESWAIRPGWYQKYIEPWSALVLQTIRDFLPAQMKTVPIPRGFNLLDLPSLEVAPPAARKPLFRSFEIG